MSVKSAAADEIRGDGGGRICRSSARLTNRPPAQMENQGKCLRYFLKIAMAAGVSRQSRLAVNGGSVNRLSEDIWN